MRLSACHDPCLSPCDERLDCCCDRLGLESEVVYSTSALPGYSTIESLKLRWSTPVAQCVLDRAGVLDEQDLTFSIFLVCPGSFPATPDLEVTGADITAGEVTFTRDEIMGVDYPYGACLSDFGISPCLTLLDGDTPLLTCYACPEGCDGYPSPPPPSPPPSPTPSPGCSCVLSVVATASPCEDGQSFVSISASVELIGDCDYPNGRVKIAVTGYHDPIPDGDPGAGEDGLFAHAWSGQVGCSEGVPLIVIVWFEGRPGQNFASECGETRIELTV